MIKRIPTGAAAAVALLLAGVAGSCSRSSDKAAAAVASARPSAFKVSDAQRARLQIVTVATTKFRPTLEVTGTVAFNGDRSTQVLSPISGPVRRIDVSLGAAVVPGQPLAAVSSPDFAAAVATYRKAETTLRNTARILTRNEQLFANDALARSDLEQARNDNASAAADREAAMLALRALGLDEPTVAAIRDGQIAAPVESAIRAPIRGTVVEKLINPGQMLQAGTTPAFTVADLQTMWVMASVYTADIPLLSAGNPVDILTDASATPTRGRVDYIAPIVDPGTKAVAVRVVAENPGQVLKRDMFVRMFVHSRSERAGLLVPVAAVLRDEESLPFVFVAAADGTFARHRVTLGYRVDDRYEITSGLSAGDKVVSDGALFIQFAESQ